MPPAAVLFDLDDTLYPYAPCNTAGKRGAHERALELGYEFDEQAFESCYQTGRSEVKREIDGQAASHDRVLYFKRALELHTGGPRLEHAHELGQAYWTAYLEAIEPFPDTVSTLETLREREIAVGITTNLTARIQLAKVDRLGLDGYIDAFVTSEEVGREKPASVMFTVPLARLDCQPSDAVMVGDNPTTDIVGANAVGLETVLLEHDVEHADGRPGDETAANEPDARIFELGALTELV